MSESPELKLVLAEAEATHMYADGAPMQSEMPFAVVDGEAVTELPRDLYIPPHALQVFLEAFEGPLDMLLYLIKRQNLDVLDIPILEVTRQYVQYIELMNELQLELAGEYLLMAAMLAEIKSRMLLPRSSSEELDEDDPRAELVRRLQEYERYKQAAEQINALPRLERDITVASAEIPERKVVEILPDVTLKEMLICFREAMARAEMFASVSIQREALSVRERMSEVLSRLSPTSFLRFTELFKPEEGRTGVTVTFLAILELIKESLIEVVQTEPYAPIHIKPSSAKIAGGEDDVQQQVSS